jgi:hypothetical protein
MKAEEEIEKFNFNPKIGNHLRLSEILTYDYFNDREDSYKIKELAIDYFTNLGLSEN